MRYIISEYGEAVVSIIMGLLFVVGIGAALIVIAMF